MTMPLVLKLGDVHLILHLRRLRLKHGLTQAAFAAKLGMCRSDYQKKESGKYPIHLLELVRMARVLHEPLSALIEMCPDPLPEEEPAHA